MIEHLYAQQGPQLLRVAIKGLARQSITHIQRPLNLMTPPDELPESMTLKPNLITWSLVMLGGCGILALMFLGNDTEGWMHVLGTLMGCGLVATSLVCLWPNSTWIKLGPDGLRMRILFRNIHHRWCDINGLRIKAMQALGTNVAN